MFLIKRTVWAFVILLIVAFMLRGWIYRNSVTYKGVGSRVAYMVLEQNLIDYIDSYTDIPPNPQVEQIISASLAITAKQLNYTFENNDVDPNRLINSKSAHCVGYAQFFASTCNYLLEKHHLAEQWTAKPQIGHLHFLGNNIHKYFNHPYFKDHDFVTVENINSGEILAVDPTIYDYIGIKVISYQK